jgi:alpha-amylase/alpha-mannosidase (GH57 family)
MGRRLGGSAGPPPRWDPRLSGTSSAGWAPHEARRCVELEKFVCIHAHFYQPPRENPWLAEIEAQESALPYHDWNERITAECYSPNTASPILDARGEVERTVNNYSKISFNFGPTLLSWMEAHRPEVYGAIISTDKETRQSFSGHGSAIAQVYNHMIMPLASRRDKQTQVRWGIADFESRFWRRPEGMWLPETAVDLESLETLAEASIKFTLLSPHQAGRVRRIGEEGWSDVEGGRIDTRRPYLCTLPSGRSISVFFYDPLISHAVAFEGILHDGEGFARRLVAGFTDEEGAQLVNIATDGETYGHHHRHGNMALAYCLNNIGSSKPARLTNYGEFLEKSPPRFEVQIVENTSWSCAHGVERWRSDCGCSIQQAASSGQAWRRPLRDAMDWLRDELATLYETEASKYLLDPWRARDGYISVLLDHREGVADRFIAEHLKMGGLQGGAEPVIDLLEMQRYAMLMFTSCGWFWDDISGIETVQIMRYAARAMQLARASTGADLEPQFVRMIEAASSNDHRFLTGGGVYRMLVKPAVVEDLGRQRGAP